MTPLTPFKKILIANRAEIALRIIRSARRLGLSTVSVYSTADRHAQHVRLADQAVCIGEPAPSASYLNIPRILQAAQDSGADAIHPGYGFLAENAAFAQACADQGLVFIGPSPAAIEAMGDKARAKRIMREAGVPCIPGYDDDDQDAGRLAAEAARIGYPVMIKATAGGGGRGMRIVESAPEFHEALATAQSEALAAFGSQRVILERALRNPRHIEIQVVADRRGHAIHLGERDCSVQRRHQKIIEEAPAPGLDARLRQAMGQAAVDAARAIGYEGVGTLEFLLDTDGAFYFMEMNTRLQVEHPITEAITGLDLVELQIRAASGEDLDMTQQEVQFEGHAIEVRLCAEDCERGFVPQSGEIAFWAPPEQARVECAVKSGDAITPYYDSMFAKVITHAPDRDQAVRRMQQALQDTVLFGLRTNLSFLTQCLQHPAWLRGGVDTGFIERYQDELLSPAPSTSAMLAIAATLSCHQPGDSPRVSRQRAALLSLREDAQEAATDIRVIRPGPNTYEVRLGDNIFHITILAQETHHTRLTLDGREHRTWHTTAQDRLYLRWQGKNHTVLDETFRTLDGPAEHLTDGRMRAASSCRVTAIHVEAGDTVKLGDAVLTTEAMKMEYRHTAPYDGVVRQINVQVGDQIAEQGILAILEPGTAA